MGQVFQRLYRAADGSVRVCETWTIRYFRNGKAHQEPTKFKRKTDAQNLLRSREGAIANGAPITAAMLKLTFDDAAADVINDFKVNGKRSLAVVQRRIDKHLRPFFGGKRMSDITSSDVRAFVAHRQAQTVRVRKAYQLTAKDGTVRTVTEQRRIVAGVSNAEINRELQVLKRCFSLAVQAGKLMSRPHVPMLRESAPRSGFFERSQMEAVRRHLPESLRGLVSFAYITGWRIRSEVQSLEWRQVDFEAGAVSLDPGQTKNGEARVFPMTTELRKVLEAQRTKADAAKRDGGHLVPWVFFRMVAKGRGGKRYPKPITAFTIAWKRACRVAGCPGRIPHDFRRSAVRNLVRAGIPERVAMQMTGHKTRSVFERYNITSAADLTDAARRLNEADRDSFVTVESSEGQPTTQTKRIS